MSLDVSRRPLVPMPVFALFLGASVVLGCQGTDSRTVDVSNTAADEESSVRQDQPNEQVSTSEEQLQPSESGEPTDEPTAPSLVGSNDPSPDVDNDQIDESHQISPTQSDSPPAVPKDCPDAHERPTCESINDCEWQDDECVEKVDCSDYSDESNCDDLGECEWQGESCEEEGQSMDCSDYEPLECPESECERIGPHCLDQDYECSDFEQSDCPDPECMWKDDVCQDFQEIGCSEFTSGLICKDADNCLWVVNECLLLDDLVCRDYDHKQMDCPRGDCAFIDDICYDPDDVVCDSYSVDSCPAYPCFVNDQDQCRHRSEQVCADQDSQNTCSSLEHCLWLGDNNSCANKADVPCSTFPKPQACLEGYCEWKDDTCQPLG